MLQYKVVVTSVLDASVLYAARITNTHLALLDHRIATAFQKTYAPRSYHFDYLIIDEAAQASEPEIAPALSVVCPDRDSVLTKPEHAIRRWPQLVLCGDHHQLSAFITSHEARTLELDLSLIQRLFERPLYKDHPRARHNLPSAKGSKLLAAVARVGDSAMLQISSGSAMSRHGSNGASEDGAHRDMSAPFANLINNYRSHPGLLMVPSSLFYDDTLEPHASQAVQHTRLLQWQEMTSRNIPLLVWNIPDGSEEMFEEGASWYNDKEVDKVIDVVKSLVFASGTVEPAHESVKPAEIGVISPFREQVRFPALISSASHVRGSPPML